MSEEHICDERQKWKFDNNETLDYKRQEMSRLLLFRMEATTYSQIIQSTKTATK